MGNAQSILPEFDVFTAPGVSVPPGAMTEAAAGTGLGGKARLFALSPVFAAVRGLGADEEVVVLPTGEARVMPISGGDALWSAAILIVAGALSYQAGKAMAPSPGDRTTWGIIGVPVGLFTGIIGLGVMGLVSNQKGG